MYDNLLAFSSALLRTMYVARCRLPFSVQNTDMTFGSSFIFSLLKSVALFLQLYAQSWTQIGVQFYCLPLLLGNECVVCLYACECVCVC